MGATRWEVYAWAVRSIMIDQGNFTSSNVPYKVKLVFEQFMNKVKGAIHPDDMTEEVAPDFILKS